MVGRYIIAPDDHKRRRPVVDCPLLVDMSGQEKNQGGFMSLDARMVDVKADLVNRRHDLVKNPEAVLKELGSKYNLTEGELLGQVGLMATWIVFHTVLEESTTD